MFERFLTSIRNILKIAELRQRIFFTAAMLVVFRVGAHIPTPGVNNEALREFLTQKGGPLMGFLDIFSGGALSRLSIFSLGIMPYISSSIIMQLLTVVIPTLSKLAKEGEQGRKKITQYTRLATIGIGLVQAIGIAIGLEGMNDGVFVQNPGWGFRLMTMVTITAGTAFLMWLGEQITERGIGNGISLIIFSGIVAGIPSAIFSTYQLYQAGEVNAFFILFLLLLMVAVTVAVVFLESGRRKIPVQYARRMVGRKVYGGQSTHIPLKINTSGVIPPIFASSLIAVPATVAGFITVPWVRQISEYLSPGTVSHSMLYVFLIIFFAFFYTAVVLNPVDMADNMKKYGGFIPGIRPGTNTSDYIYRILTRITLVGALYLSVVAVLPEILIYRFSVPFFFGGTSLLIVIGVGLDTAQQIETQMLTRNYEGFLKKGRITGRGSAT
ncbi:MAG: preprotein translocase subunit SecY [Nitrospirota bacterium]